MPILDHKGATRAVGRVLAFNRQFWEFSICGQGWPQVVTCNHSLSNTERAENQIQNVVARSLAGDAIERLQG